MLSSCIERIRTQTNIQSLDELVTSFQSSFEENLKLKDYAERLSCEIDELTIQLTSIRKMIEANTSLSQKTEDEIGEIVMGSRTKIENIHRNTEAM